MHLATYIMIAMRLKLLANRLTVQQLDQANNKIHLLSGPTDTQ